MSSELVKPFLEKIPALEDRLREELGGRWGDGERILSAAIGNEETANLIISTTAGEKSRLGIAYLAIMAWEQIRPQAVEPVQRSLIGANAALSGMSKALEKIGEKVSKDFEKCFDRIAALESKLEGSVGESPKNLQAFQEKLDNAVAQISSVSAGKDDPVPGRLDELIKKIDEREAKLVSLREKRLAEKRARAGEKALKRQEVMKQADEKAKKREADRKRQAAAAARKKEIREKKAAGLYPYSIAETVKFAANLERKGKTFYTLDERIAYKAKLKEEGKDPDAKPKPSDDTKERPRKKFVRYTPEQKAKYIRDNFLSKGRKYYTKSERIRHKKELEAKAKAEAEEGSNGQGGPKDPAKSSV